jgi:CheY-like chemotaxis protein
MAGSILVVEDDRDIRKNLNRLLASEGYTVVLAENGQVALDYLSNCIVLPNLIILDLMMPVMDGFEFRTIQSADPRFEKIPAIIMTADGHLDEKRMRTAAHDAIRKPADIETILRVVKQVC